MKKPVIGLALSGGSALGFAHIGVLEELEKNGIKAQIVTGTSMGAIVGGAYAKGLSMEVMTSYAKKITKSKFVDGNFFKNGGVFQGSYINRMFKEVFGETNIEELDTKFACIACDINSGKEVVFDKGSLRTAVRASMNIPGLFAPIKHENMCLVDGGVTNNLPDNVAKKMGADIIIAVNVLENSYPHFKGKRVVNALIASLQMANIYSMKNRKKYANIELKPEIDYLKTGINLFSYDKNKIDTIIEAGRIEAKKMMPKILEIVENWKETKVKK